MTWTGPAEIAAQLGRLWDRGHLLVPAQGEPLFPLDLRFSRPDARALSERFDDVRRWIRALEEGSKGRQGHGYEIRWIEVNHRQLGPNRVPAGVVVPTVEDALELIGKQAAAARWQAQRARTERACPALVPWLTRKPMILLEHLSDWERILAVVTWFQAHPRADVYLRQLDVPGIHTKFIEARRGLIAELLDQVLPPELVRADLSPTRQFEARYGLRVKPALVRFRILDERLAVGGLTDIATPAAQFARLGLPVRRVFVTENEINGVSFPPTRDSLVIFGLGYGLDRLAEIGWLHDKAVHYWGDIDTHGFAMLDLLRAKLPIVRSLLMDRETLMAHREAWGAEPVQHEGTLERLLESERSVYEELRAGMLGERVRLEQERIAFSWLASALRAIEG
jgi:hypothetical protein